MVRGTLYGENSGHGQNWELRRVSHGPVVLVALWASLRLLLPSRCAESTGQAVHCQASKISYGNSALKGSRKSKATLLPFTPSGFIMRLGRAHTHTSSPRAWTLWMMFDREAAPEVLVVRSISLRADQLASMHSNRYLILILVIMSRSVNNSVLYSGHNFAK